MKNLNHHSWKQTTDHQGNPSLLVPVAVGEDFDYCFGNTNETMRVVEHVAALHTHLTISEIRAAREEVEARHEPFSTVAFIEKELQRAGEGKTWANDLKPYILEKAREAEHRKRLLMVGARAVFDVARRHGMYEVVVTHGAVASPAGPLERWAAYEWQTTKVDMTPEICERPTVVTETSSKDEEFESWWVPEADAFRLPQHTWLRPDEPVYARAVVHLDDKSKIFKKGFDGNRLFGIHVLPERDEDIRATQLGELPPSVRRVRGLPQGADVLTAMRYTHEELGQHYDDQAA